MVEQKTLATNRKSKVWKRKRKDEGSNSLQHQKFLMPQLLPQKSNRR